MSTLSKTAIREITRATLDNFYAEQEKDIPLEQRKQQYVRDVEEESVSFIVCQHYGIDTSDYSFTNLAEWSRQPITDIKKSLANIRKTASDMITSIDERLQEISQLEEKENPLLAAEISTEQNYNMIDGIINNEPFMPDATMNERANFLIDFVERDGQRFGNQERHLIVEYAEAIQDNQKLFALINELAEHGFEQKEGYINPDVVKRVDAEIKDAKVQRMIDSPLNPTKQPIVTVIWSENDQLESGQQMTLAEANSLFKQLDDAHTEPGYDKTKFCIDYTFEGELNSYEGRQDFGDGDGTLIEHIKAFQEYYAHLEGWKNHIVHTNGEEAWQNEAAHYEMMLNKFIPYMQMHCDLTQLEQAGSEQLAMLRDLPNPDALDQSKIAYYEAVQTYVNDCRHELNTALNEYHFPEMPKEQDFYIPELLDYQKQVNKEVEQEARDAGMTVEEYAANDYEPPPIMDAGDKDNYVNRDTHLQTGQKQNDFQSANNEPVENLTGAISSDDPKAILKLETKLAKLEELQTTMKAVNAYYRENKTLDGCPNLTQEQIEELKDDMKHWSLENKPYPSFRLSNNNAEIKRLNTRIEGLKLKEKTAYVGWEFNGGTAEINREDNRLQLFFNKKPDYDTRTELKKRGFHWSPKVGAWQRQLTDNAFHSANSIKAIQPITGESPLELQRKARTAPRPSVREQLTSRNSTTPIPDEVQEPTGQPSLAVMEQLSGTESTVEGNTDILDMEQTEQTFSNFDSVCNGKSQSTETATQDETIEKKPSIREQLAESRSPFCSQKEIQIGKKQDKELAL